MIQVFDGLAATSDPNRTSVGIGCEHCVIYGKQCDGFVAAFDCMDNCTCIGSAACMKACPKSRYFAGCINEINGLECRADWSIRQKRKERLPLYIPKIHHGYMRRSALDWPIVALSTYSLLTRHGRVERVFSSARKLRRSLKLNASARIIAVSADKDHKLERYWLERKQRSLPHVLAKLGVTHVTAPNFSFPRNVPRFEQLRNLKRSLICAEEMSAEGLSVIPHLNAGQRLDWEFWVDFLRERPEIEIVAKEFQTGLSVLDVGLWHIDSLRRLEDALGRGLHLLAIGGRQFMPWLKALGQFTVLDSAPFMKTLYRQAFDVSTKTWRPVPTARRDSLDRYLAHNISAYNQLLQSEMLETSGARRIRPKGETTTVMPPPFISQSQMTLWAS